MSWADALPAIGVLVVCLLAPGLAMAEGLGLRGWLAVGTAPALSMTALAGGAVLTPLIGLRFSPVVALGWTAVAAAVCAALGWLLRDRFGPPAPRPRPRRIDYAAMVVAALTVVSLGAVLAHAMGTPTELVDSPDAVFHANRLRTYLEAGNASSLLIGYPSAFHALGYLAVDLTGVPILAVINLVSLTSAAVAWPLGSIALARACLGRSTLITVTAGLTAMSFTSMPYNLMGWGVLWPNVLGTAILPGCLAAMASTGRGSGRQPVVIAATVIAIPGLTLAHPNALVSMLLVALVMVLVTLTRRARRQSGSARRHTIVSMAALSLGVLAAMAVLPRISRIVAVTAGYTWGNLDSLPKALRDAGLFALFADPRWPIVVGAYVGVAVVLRRPARNAWVALGLLVTSVLYVLSATTSGPVTSFFTGFWYNDKVRLAALAGVFVVVLVPAGMFAIRDWIGTRIKVSRDVAALQRLGVVVLLAAVALGLNPREGHRMLTSYYFPPNQFQEILSGGPQGDLADLHRVAAMLPPGAVVAGDPSNGSALLYAMHGIRVLMPTLGPSPDPRVTLLGTDFRSLDTRTDVCDAVRSLGVTHVVDAEPQYWGRNAKATDGLVELADVEGLRLIGVAGRYTVYEVTACR